jgi:hypothetical protein
MCCSKFTPMILVLADRAYFMDSLRCLCDTVWANADQRGETKGFTAADSQECVHVQHNLLKFESDNVIIMWSRVDFASPVNIRCLVTVYVYICICI